MKSYKEFISLVERYYEPDEVLPSGKTPYGKARSSFSRQTGEYKRTPVQSRTKNQADRLNRQTVNLFTKVKRGANNPNFDLTPSRDYEVDGDASRFLRVRDPNTGINMTASRREFTNTGKPIYNVSWYNPYKISKTRDVLRNVQNIWQKEFLPRVPSNVSLESLPITNSDGKRNTRAKLYAQFGNFKSPDNSKGAQFVNVKRPPSPKQQNKGVTRNQPIEPDFALMGVRKSIDLEKKYIDLDQQERKRSMANRLFPERPRQTSPRVIAKAKLPYRPTLAPSKVASNKISKIRPRGRVGIVASLAAAGLGALATSRQQQKAKENK